MSAHTPGPWQFIGPHFVRIEAASGDIELHPATEANARLIAAAGDLELRPTLTAGGEIDWSCKGPGTTIPAKYLPANCRP